jgi:C-methyltransferase
MDAALNESRRTIPPSRVPPVIARLAQGVHRALGRVRNYLLPPEAVMLNQIYSLKLLRCIWIAAELGIADRLAHGAMHVDDLARAVDANPDALRRVLRALASADIFEESAEGTFALNRLANCLATDAPSSVRASARYMGSQWNWAAWGALMPTVRNGRTIHENVHQQRFFEHYEANGYTPMFDAAMTGLSSLFAPAIVDGYDFGTLNSLVDIAGGEGALLAEILKANPSLRGALYERPEVIERAQSAPFLAAPELQSRATFVSGDIFEAIPGNFDGYFMKWILHDWSDAQAARILDNVRRAARSGARLIVAEMVLETSNTTANLLDVAMLALTGGRERTASEYRKLFSTAGFELVRVHPTASPFSLLEGLAR